MTQLPFPDRREAGRLLGAELARRDLPDNNIIVLGLPRGGVVTAFEVATALRAPLDVVVVRKLGVPSQPELAIGAVAGGRIRLLDEDLIQQLGIPKPALDEVVVKEMDEVDRREKLYRHDRAAPDLCGWTVVLVDDGVATGSTMAAAVDYVNSFHPAEVIVTTPVASVQACQHLKRLVDRCVCLATPEPFHAVSEWYADFRQVTDIEVQRLLERRRRQTGPLTKTIVLERQA